MSRSFSASLLTVLALLASVFSSAQASLRCERLVAVGAPLHPPYLWQDPARPKQLQGVHAELLQRLGRELGVEIELQAASTAGQAREEVASGRADLLLGVALDNELLTAFDVVHPPLDASPSVLWVPREAAFSYSGWNDLLGRKGLLLPGAGLDGRFEAFARANLALREVADLPQALARLAQGEADYLILDRYAGTAQLATLGRSDELRALDWPVATQAHYLALSHNSTCNDPFLRSQLALKMLELSRAGVAEGLLQLHMQQWLEQSAAAAVEPVQE